MKALRFQTGGGGGGGGGGGDQQRPASLRAKKNGGGVLREGFESTKYKIKDQKAKNKTKGQKQTHQKSPPTTSHGG